jgi:hypothetical protein
MWHFTKDLGDWNKIGTESILHKAVAYQLGCIVVKTEEVEMQTVENKIDEYRQNWLK